MSDMKNSNSYAFSYIKLPSGRGEDALVLAGRAHWAPGASPTRISQFLKRLNCGKAVWFCKSCRLGGASRFWNAE